MNFDKERSRELLNSSLRPFKGKIRKETVEKAVEVSDYLIANESTVRAVAKKFNISKSTVHRYVTAILSAIKPIEAQKAKEILEKNFAEKHLRGGNATKNKYQKEISL